MVRNDNIGDVLCSTPALRALRQAFPKAYIAALVVRYSQDAIVGNPDVDEVFTYEKAKHRPDQNRVISLYWQWQVQRQLQKKRFDLAIGLRSIFSWSEAWLVYFTGARFRLGYRPEKMEDRRFAFFYNMAIPPLKHSHHEVERVLHLVGQLGGISDDKDLRVFIPEEERKKVTSFIAENKIDAQRLVGFNLSARVPSNHWNPQNFASLASRLIHDDKKFVVLTCGPGDQALVQEVKSNITKGIFYYPTPNLKSLGALQARCRVFLSSDGGPMHFATAVGTPTVGLFGKTDPAVWGPWGNKHVALRKGINADMISVEEVHQVILKKLGN